MEDEQSSRHVGLRLFLEYVGVPRYGTLGQVLPDARALRTVKPLGLGALSPSFRGFL